jgi:glycosyltransferase involved in cell wall biosynthesis
MRVALLLSLLSLPLLLVVKSDDECAALGYERSKLLVDLHWVIQGYSFGFQGFFVEMLGLSGALADIIPNSRVVKSNFRQSMSEPALPDAHKFLNFELFEKEGRNLERLMSEELLHGGVGGAPASFPKSKFMRTPTFPTSDCDDEASFTQGQAYSGGELGKFKYPSVDARQCCVACVDSPLCISWTYSQGGGGEVGECLFQGRPAQLAPLEGAVSGRVATMVQTKDMDDKVVARWQIPRVVVYHGTTCIHNNQSVSAMRDIDTVRVGRYMLERGHMQGGLNLDEYAVLYCAARMDELWVPTEWHREVFQRLLGAQGSSSSVPPIYIIPEAVDTELFDPHYQRGAVPRTSRVDVSATVSGDITPSSGDSGSGGGGEGGEGGEGGDGEVGGNCRIHTVDGNVVCDGLARFQFLSIFKWEYRKGWEILLDAYWAAFKPSDAVVLRLRCYLPSSSAGDGNITRLVEEYALSSLGLTLEALPQVSWERGVEGLSQAGTTSKPLQPLQPLHSISNETSLTREDMRDLLHSADAFVLPTRGEGWGLPIAEAMSMALPVIVSNHSGPAAYATQQNSYLLKVLPSLDATSYAIPCSAHLTQLMREVVFDASTEGGFEAQRRGRAARATMQQISPQSIVCKIADRVRELIKVRGWELP